MKDRKPTKKEISRVMSHIGSIKTKKRAEAARKTAALARASYRFKYRKIKPADIIDIRKNCPMEWKRIKVFAKKYKLNPATVWSILKNRKHADDCQVQPENPCVSGENGA